MRSDACRHRVDTLSIRKAPVVEITRTPAGTRPGPAHWFTGQVWMEDLAAPPAPSRVHALRVHFPPGARTAWHRHALGQVLYVTEGIGLVQRRGAPPQVIRAGDVVWFEPDEDHWHGAAPDHFMTHIAIHELNEEGEVADWGDQVSEDEYRQPSLDG
jgi:quercetin dioxygenase-like cupin family protein